MDGGRLFPFDIALVAKEVSFLVLDILNMLVPIVLGISSFTAGAWLIDNILRRTDEPGIDIESVGRTIIKIFQFFGMVMGILCFAGLVSALFSGLFIYNDLLTLVLLGILGFVLLVAPIAKFPWAAVLGLIIGVIIAAALAFLTPAWVIALLPFPFHYVVIGVFLIVGLLVFIAFKWIEDLTRSFAIILASKPVTVVLMILGIIQAVALIFLPSGLLTLIGL
ncbi:MAG: hypothetical protein ACFFDP_11950 [Promethearchaeota archaeon]